MHKPDSVVDRALKPLAFALPLLAVVMVASFATLALFQTLGDAQVVAAMALVTKFIAAILMTALVLLASCLGLRAVAEDERNAERGREVEADSKSQIDL